MAAIRAAPGDAKAFKKSASTREAQSFTEHWNRGLNETTSLQKGAPTHSMGAARPQGRGERVRLSVASDGRAPRPGPKSPVTRDNATVDPASRRIDARQLHSKLQASH